MKINSEFLGLGILTEELETKQNIQVSLSLTREEIGLVGQEKFHTLLFQEASQAIDKKILDEISKTNEHFLDVMNLSEAYSINHLHHYLMNRGFDWCIFNGQIGMYKKVHFLLLVLLVKVIKKH